MAISLRSHLIASVAFVGAATIALTPIAQPEVMPSLQRSSAAYQLSALANPITAIAGVVESLNYQIFSGEVLGNDPATYEFADPYWTDFFTATDPFTDPPGSFRYGPQTLGLIPDLASGFSTNALSAVISNLSNYGFAAGEVALALGTGAATGVWNAPANLVAAVGYIAAGDSAAALAELTQIVAPLQAGIQVATDAITYITSNLTRNVQTVLTATLPKLLGGLARATVGGLTFLTQSAIATITQVVTDLAGLKFEAAWNGAVNGFLSNIGTLGQVNWLTVAPIGFPNPADLTTGNPWVSPSLRNVITTVAVETGSSAVLNEALGLAGIRNEPFYPGPLPAATVPSSAKNAARSAASVRPAAAAPAVAVSAVETAAGDNGGVSAGPSPTKPIKHRAARRAAAAG